MPNLSDAVLEAGGTIYSRSAKTNRFTELISHDTNDVGTTLAAVEAAA